jgi:hypothetical protein
MGQFVANSLSERIMDSTICRGMLAKQLKVPGETFESIMEELGFAPTQLVFNRAEAHHIVLAVRAWYMYYYSVLLSQYK